MLVGTAFSDPIHDAAMYGNLAGVQAELDKGVDVNAKNDFGDTPLDMALWLNVCKRNRRPHSKPRR